ncbi:MAG: FdhD protein, partial [Actinomycetota bacterium]|nr:FdhD protein [Actinomycetota bacterium]
MIAERPGSTTKATVVGYTAGSVVTQADSLATEEPLEIRISIAGRSRTVAVTMRTPGADFELAVGFLFGEGVIARRDQVVGVSYCKDTDLPVEHLYNIVIVELDPTSEPDLRPLDRHFYTSSACGVCGKANLEAIALRGTTKVDDAVTVDPNVLSSLPDKLGQVQAVFSSTGGLHAAALFTSQGELIGSREDVGRHN